MSTQSLSKSDNVRASLKANTNNTDYCKKRTRKAKCSCNNVTRLS